MNETTENGTVALDSNGSESTERDQAAEYHQLKSTGQTDYLQQAMIAGRLPPEFLLENISSNEWHEAMVAHRAQA